MVRAGRRLLSAVLPEGLKDGPTPGQWRERKRSARYGDRLFADILVPVSGEPAGGYALEEALLVAEREQAQLHGFHVVPNEDQRESEAALAVRAQFNERCAAAGVPGSLACEAGNVAQTISKRAALTDLVVLNLSYAPAPQALARLGSSFRTIIHRCPRPALAVPQPWPAPGRVLLARDDRPKSREALFVAAYLGESWRASLTVVTVKDARGKTAEALAHAREYLDMHELKATDIERDRGPAAAPILQAAQDDHSDLIVIGGYGATPVVDIVMGRAVDQVLRESRRPMLIGRCHIACRGLFHAGFCVLARSLIRRLGCWTHT